MPSAVALHVYMATGPRRVSLIRCRADPPIVKMSEEWAARFEFPCTGWIGNTVCPEKCARPVKMLCSTDYTLV